MTQKMKMLQHLRETIVERVPDPERMSHFRVDEEVENLASIDHPDNIQVRFVASCYSTHIGHPDQIDLMRQCAERELVYHLYDDVREKLFEISKTVKNERLGTETIKQINELIDMVTP